MYSVGYLLDPDHVVSGSVALVCTTVSVRNHFLFEARARTVFTLATLLGSAAALLFGAYKLVPQDGMLFAREKVQRGMVNSTFIMSMCIASELYFDYIRQGVYDQLKGYADEVKKATELKEEFFATMSHEIRNPLQSLLGSIELLHKSGDQTHQNSLISIIKNCCEIVLNLVSNLLDVSKIEAQKLEISKIPANLTENISKILRLSATRAQSKGLAIDYRENAAIPPSLLFDPQRLHQVVINLVSNAIKFTAKGRIVVTAKWIPLERLDNVQEILHRELTTSNWKNVLYPMQEVETPPETVNSRMLQIVSHCFTPSSISAYRFIVDSCRNGPTAPQGQPGDIYDTARIISKTTVPQNYFPPSCVPTGSREVRAIS